MTTNTSQIVALLRPGLLSVYGLYEKRPKNVEKYFKKIKSDKLTEYYSQMQFLPAAQVKAQGTSAFMADMAQAYQPTITNITLGISTAFTHEAIQDNLYKKAFPEVAKASYVSMLSAVEQIAANVFNLGFSATEYDGVTFFNTAHPLGGGQYGTVANTYNTVVSLSEESLSDAITAVKYTFKDQAGNLFSPSVKSLMVSQDLEPIAKKLTRSMYEPGSPNNAVNYVHDEVSSQYITNPYLNSNSWFLNTDVEGAIYQDREPINPYVYEDVNTRSVIINSLVRFGVGITDWRCAFGGKGI